MRYTGGATRLAYDIIGRGEPTLVVIPGWVSHLTFDWATPEIRAFYRRLAARRRVIRFDKRGSGLSDCPPGPDAYTLDHDVADLDALYAGAGLGRCALFGWSEGGAIALAFAARYPERVSQLVLYGAHARLTAAPEYPIGKDPARTAGLLTFVRNEWGLGSRLFAEIFLPELDAARLAWFTAYQRAARSPQAAADALAAIYALDIRALLPTVRTPALVLHRRHDCLIPFALGEYLAAHLPRARLVALEGDQHLPYIGDVAALIGAIDGFLRAEPAREPPPGPPPALTPRECEVLGLLAEGLPNREIAARLSLSEKTVNSHLARIFTKLGVNTRSAAAAYAFRHGYV
ncbi:MAG TPA: alpha/beta fold hydrolase [Thermomicrobiales bacterium]|nr:alpha/beta fold hydrolase [Thermomicrobiales bacterium]